MSDETVKVGENEVPKDVYQEILKNGRQSVYKELNLDINKNFDGLLDELRKDKENAGVKDVLQKLAEQNKAMQDEIEGLKHPDKKKKEPLELEKELAKQRAEMEKQLQAEKGSLFRQSIENQIAAKLVAKGWKDSYSHIIPSLIASHFAVEQDGESAIFRDVKHDRAIMQGAITERADEIAKAYPEMIATPQAGLGAGQVKGTMSLPDKPTIRQELAAGLEAHLAKK